MKALFQLLYILLSAQLACGQKDIDLKILGYNGKVKQVEIMSYELDTEKNPPDSIARYLSIYNFDERGNLLTEESQSLKTALTTKKIYKYRDGLKAGYTLYISDVLVATATIKFKDPHRMEEIIEFLVGDIKQGSKLYVFNDRYRTEKVFIAANKYAEYKYDTVNDLTTITTMEDGELSDISVEQIELKDDKGNPAKTAHTSGAAMFKILVDYYTFTYY